MGSLRPALGALLLASSAACGVFVSFDDYETARTGEGPRYAVKGRIDGLAGSTRVTLGLNGVSQVQIGNGDFSFETRLAFGADYLVTVEDPDGHHCVVEGGTGTIEASDVVSVGIHCIPGPATLTVTPDEDPRPGSYAGVVTIGRAPDETNVRRYDLYWALEGGATLEPRIASFPTSGAEIVFRVEGPLPPRASRFVAVSARADDETSPGRSAPFSDNFPVHADISLKRSLSFGSRHSAVIVPPDKLVVVGGSVLASNQGTDIRPSLFRCNLDGSDCTHADISLGRPSSGVGPSAVLDRAGGKLLVVTTWGSLAGGLFRCGLDGTDCNFTSISDVQSGGSVVALVDEAGKKLLAAAQSASTDHRLALGRCNLDGTGCSQLDISAGQGPNSGEAPSAVLDAANGKLLVVTRNASAGPPKPSLFRCNLDGTGCSHTDISVGRPFDTNFVPSAEIDVANAKLLVALETLEGKLGLVRCNLDGSSCVHHDLSAGQPPHSGRSPSIVVDAKHETLLVATRNGANEDRPSLFRCNLDATACTHLDLSAGQGPSSGVEPFALLDPGSGRLLVVTQNQTRPSLFTLGLW